MISFFGVGDSAITSLKLFSLVILPVVPFFGHVAVLALLLVLALLIVFALLVDLVVATVCWRLVELRCMPPSLGPPCAAYAQVRHPHSAMVAKLILPWALPAACCTGPCWTMLLDSQRQSVATILLDSKQSVAHTAGRTMDPGSREPAEAEVAAVPVFWKPF